MEPRSLDSAGPVQRAPGRPCLALSCDCPPHAAQASMLSPSCMQTESVGRGVHVCILKAFQIKQSLKENALEIRKQLPLFEK